MRDDEEATKEIPHTNFSSLYFNKTTNDFYIIEKLFLIFHGNKISLIDISTETSFFFLVNLFISFVASVRK